MTTYLAQSHLTNYGGKKRKKNTCEFMFAAELNASKEIKMQYIHYNAFRNLQEKKADIRMQQTRNPQV